MLAAHLRRTSLVRHTSANAERAAPQATATPRPRRRATRAPAGATDAAAGDALAREAGADPRATTASAALARRAAARYAVRRAHGLPRGRARSQRSRRLVRGILRLRDGRAATFRSRDTPASHRPVGPRATARRSPCLCTGPDRAPFRRAGVGLRGLVASGSDTRRPHRRRPPGPRGLEEAAPRARPRRAPPYAAFAALTRVLGPPRPVV